MTEQKRCPRCNGEQFVSATWSDMPDEPCPVCNSGAPSGAERVRAAASFAVSEPQETNEEWFKNAKLKVTRQAFIRIALTSFNEQELRVIAENLLALCQKGR